DLTGADAEAVGDEIGVALNKNAIPFDPRPPLKASGIRIGTPGPATLGMDEPEMKEISSILGDALRAPADTQVKERARGRVAELVKRFPLYA
ncbi:MAG: serine hydroxymethyltransferase, partial [Actinobacteria bacterium]|nr:serine hydroxymethyltransferase [Actinomycetota bacterium]